MAPLLRRKESKPEGLSCVSFNTDGVAVAHIISTSESRCDVSHCDFLPISSLEESPVVLSRYVRKNKLTGSDCACVLCPCDYHLLLLDAPNVPDEELKQATHFLIKDLINFPINEAAIDIFTIPTYNDKPKIYAVAARMKRLQELMRWMEQADLSTRYIDVTELALRNLVALDKMAKEGVALLFIHAKSIYVVIVCEDNMCFTRRISLISDDIRSVNLDNLVTELNQSFDYYQSQITQKPLSKLLLAPMGVASQTLLSLTDKLTIPVELIDLNTFVALKNSLSAELQHRCLPVLSEGLQIKEILEDIKELV